MRILETSSPLYPSLSARSNTSSGWRYVSPEDARTDWTKSNLDLECLISIGVRMPEPDCDERENVASREVASMNSFSLTISTEVGVPTDRL